jgi:hypothetical protein
MNLLLEEGAVRELRLSSYLYNQLPNWSGWTGLTVLLRPCSVLDWRYAEGKQIQWLRHGILRWTGDMLSSWKNNKKQVLGRALLLATDKKFTPAVQHEVNKILAFLVTSYEDDKRGTVRMIERVRSYASCTLVQTFRRFPNILRAQHK